MKLAYVPALLGVLTVAPPLSGQASSDGWALRLGVSRDAFTGASSDTTAVPGTVVDVQPAPRVAFEIGLRRAFRGWEVIVAAGYATGAARASTPAVLLEDRTGGVDRWRAGLLIGKRLATLDRASLVVLAGPGIDHWETDGFGNRTTVSGRAGLALRVPLGAVSFENSAFFGVGGTPFDRRYLPPEAVVHTLRTWSIGAALLIGL
ncbi:MAG TPA: hypothetical protein VMG41_11250 [Gemmatimonadales bacterium]|nr:hypothetical protein [Gemmatimonadales bacterium]